MFSIIVVYSNKKILNDWILESLKKQNVGYELILVDNTGDRFSSVAAALNYGAAQIRSKGKYIIFLHQDVKFLSHKWLEDAEKMLDMLPDLGIAGVVGARKSKSDYIEIVGNIKHGVPCKPLKHRIYIKNPEIVQTVDECLIIIPAAIFDKLKFDERVCDSWHLYAVDYCLMADKMAMGKAYVLPLPFYHRSTGTPNNYFKMIFSLGFLPGSYYDSLYKLIKKHKYLNEKIYTTCGGWEISRPIFLQKIRRLFEGANYAVQNSIRNYNENKK